MNTKESTHVKGNLGKRMKITIRVSKRIWVWKRKNRIDYRLGGGRESRANVINASYPWNLFRIYVRASNL